MVGTRVRVRPRFGVRIRIAIHDDVLPVRVV